MSSLLKINIRQLYDGRAVDDSLYFLAQTKYASKLCGTKSMPFPTEDRFFKNQTNIILNMLIIIVLYFIGKCSVFVK